jgi:hypothetical protein
MTGYPAEFCAFNGDHTPDPKDSGQGNSWEYQNVWTFFSQFLTAFVKVTRSSTALVRDRHARVRAMVDAHVKVVARTLRRAGVPSSELEDEIQRTFMVAASRIDDVQVGAERAS